MQKSLIRLLHFFGGLLLLCLANIAMAKTPIVIAPNTVISADTVYDDVILDMSSGSFIIKNKATLTIQNSVINGWVAPWKNTLITADRGNVVMNNNQVNIYATGIDPHPMTQSFHYVIQVATGKATLANNYFTVDQPFSVGLLITTESIPTQNFSITNNKFYNFHGVLYLINSAKALVKDNYFYANSYGHIVLVGRHGVITGNTIYFSGNDQLGNSIDIINSDFVEISKNLLLTPTCHALYAINSSHLTIDDNKIVGGITHAMNIYAHPEIPLAKGDEYVAKLIAKLPARQEQVQDVKITNNYMGQNRYGIGAADINDMQVVNNIFSNRFENDADRKFWTDNTNLLKNVTNLNWSNNIYKEAFTQVNGGDNTKALQYVTFPATGGVVL